MKILFVCSANIQRSRTAEDMFSYMYPQHIFNSAGTNLKICKTNGTTPLTEELLIWADKIFVMEDKHRDRIRNHTENKYGKKIFVLNIKDIYSYNDPELKRILIDKVKI